MDVGPLWLRQVIKEKEEVEEKLRWMQLARGKWETEMLDNFCSNNWSSVFLFFSFLCLAGHSDFDADAVPLPRRLRWESPRYTIFQNKIKSKIDSISTLFFSFSFFLNFITSWNGVAKTVTDRLLRVEDVLEDDAHFCPGGRLPKAEIRERRPGKKNKYIRREKVFE